MAGRRIGEVSRLLGVPVETIRYYELCGLLDKPTRTAANYRVYSDEQMERLKFILNCRNLDMTHEEIHRLLTLRSRPPKDCTEVNVVLDEHITHIDERIAELRSLSRQLHALRESCNEARPLENCTIIGTLRNGSATKQQPKKSNSHVGAHAHSHSIKRVR